MSAPAIAAIVVFGLLFIAWVILPTRVRKYHEGKAGDQTEE